MPVPVVERGSTAGHLAALAAMLCFGLMSPMCKVAMQGGVIDGLILATMRVSGAAVLFWLVSLFLPRERVRRRDLLPLFGMSLCGMAINQFCYVSGVELTSPTNGTVAATTTPVFTLVLSVLFLKLRTTRRKLFGMALAACGALVLILGSRSTGGVSGNPLGDALCLFAQFSAACYFVFFGKVLHRYSPVTMMKWLFGLSALVTLPLFAYHLITAPWAQLTVTEGIGAGYVVVGGSFISYLLLIMAQQRLEPPTVATYNYVQPAIAATVGILLGVDLLTWQKLVAIVLIAVGVRFVTHPAGR